MLRSSGLRKRTLMSWRMSCRGDVTRDLASLWLVDHHLALLEEGGHRRSSSSSSILHRLLGLLGGQIGLELGRIIALQIEVRDVRLLQALTESVAEDPGCAAGVRLRFDRLLEGCEVLDVVFDDS